MFDKNQPVQVKLKIYGIKRKKQANPDVRNEECKRIDGMKDIDVCT